MKKQFEFERLVTSLTTNSLDFTQKHIPYSKGSIEIFYIKQLTDRNSLAESVVKPLIQYCNSAKKALDANMILDEIIFPEDSFSDTDFSKVEGYILEGMTVILLSTAEEYVVANLKSVQHRQISTPKIQYSVRGPQDCFTENLDVNLSLIRYRLKDKNMQIKNFVVGKRTKSRVVVIYIQDIANDTVVGEVQKNIEAINIDGIGESGELQTFITNNKRQIFPNMGLIERSDIAYQVLLEGKVLVLVEGSYIALSAPKTFHEFFLSSDDRYGDKLLGFFSRMLRYGSLLMSFTITSLYVAIMSFNIELLPGRYTIAIAEMHINVPFPSLFAALTIEILLELLREALLRIPNHIGSAIGIVGTIIIGQAAISAGIFSPILLIIASISLLASFAIPDYSLVNPFRVLKFILLLFTGFMGFFGFTLFITMVLIELVSVNSFGVPYMAPFAPFNLYDFKRAFVQDSATDTQRAHYLRTKDKTRKG